MKAHSGPYVPFISDDDRQRYSTTDFTYLVKYLNFQQHRRLQLIDNVQENLEFLKLVLSMQACDCEEQTFEHELHLLVRQSYIMAFRAQTAEAWRRLSSIQYYQLNGSIYGLTENCVKADKRRKACAALAVRCKEKQFE